MDKAYEEILSDHKYHHIVTFGGIVYVDGAETTLDSMPLLTKVLIKRNDWFKLGEADENNQG